MEEKIKKVGDRLWDDAQHNRIADAQEWSKRLYELLDEEFPEEKLHGDRVADVEDYLHDKYSFGFCDICGEFINYDDNQWYDLQMPENYDKVVEKNMGKLLEENPDHADEIQDVCAGCYKKLTSEEGWGVDFESVVIKALEEIAKKHADDHEYESLGEWDSDGRAYQDIRFYKNDKPYYISFGSLEEE